MYNGDDDKRLNGAAHSDEGIADNVRCAYTPRTRALRVGGAEGDAPEKTKQNSKQATKTIILSVSNTTTQLFRKRNTL